MEKILTIVIPTYNMQDYLRRCLSSLIVPEEQMKQIEVLVVNDGSKDKSSAIAHEYQDKYPGTFRVIDKENGNYGSCVNRGLKEATGKYIKILDADDWFDSVALAIIVDRLKCIDVDLVLTSYNEVTPEGKLLDIRNLRFKQNEIFEFPISGTSPFEFIMMHSVIYNLNIFKCFNYVQSEGISYTDIQWVFSPMAYVRTAVYYPVCLYQYMLGREGQTMDSKVWKRSCGQYLKMVEGLVKSYIGASQSCDKAHRYFLDSILQIQLHKLYQMALIDKAISNEEMKHFDDSIVCTDIKVKNISNTINLSGSVKFPFVSYWRNKGRKPLPVCIIILGKIVRRMQILKNVMK